MPESQDSDVVSVEMISQQLDEIVVKYFETFSALCTRKQELQAAMRDGYLYMAKVSTS